MKNYKEINGDLIYLAYQIEFGVIGHGCNCFYIQSGGLAINIVKHFKTDIFSLEDYKYCGKREKLGKIDYESFMFNLDEQKFEKTNNENIDLYIVNHYSQFYYDTKFGIPVDYDVINSCMIQINNTFIGKELVEIG